MWTRSLSGKPSTAVILASLALFASPVRAQQSRLGSLESEVTEMRAENGVIREQLRKLEEQQKAILQLMEEVQRKLDGQSAAIAHQPPAQVAHLPAAQAAAQPKPPAPAAQPPADRNLAAEDPYDDSIVLVKTQEDVKVPILLKVWDISQLRYTNSQLGKSSYIDHLGAELVADASVDVQLLMKVSL
jgi:hypothetical protein